MRALALRRRFDDARNSGQQTGGNDEADFLLHRDAIVALATATTVSAGELTATKVFENLKALDGAWVGTAAGSGNPEAEAGSGMAVRHEFRVSAAGTMVMETMDPGGDHEMINAYHLDGDDLVMTHYCAGGNQPTMKVKLDESSLDHVMFEFTGGTNMDAEVDQHIHDASIRWNEDGSLVSSWRAFAGGEEAGTMVFNLHRETS